MSRSLRIGVRLMAALLPLLFGSGADKKPNDLGPNRSGDLQVHLDILIAHVESMKGRTFHVDGKRNARLKIRGSSQTNSKGRPNSATPYACVVEDASGYLEKLKALEAKGMAKVLAQPRLVTRSGQLASFFGGDEQAVPIPPGGGSVGVQFEEIGVRLNFLPTIIQGNGRIRLEIETVVNPSSGGIDAMKSETTVQVVEGEALVLGGMMLKAPPTKADEKPREMELVILVAPRLVRPSAEKRSYLTQPPVFPITLTIANVRSDEAILFTYDDKGDLVFECKVPAGKAVDVKSAPGQRWAAFFDADRRGCATPVGESPPRPQVVNHEAGDSSATWLLRESMKR